MNKAYHRINNGKGWENYPSDKTAVDEYNLNHMETGIDEIDNRVVMLDETKATKLEVSELFKDVSLDLQSGIITFTRKNGATVIIDTPMEKIQTGIYYNPNTEKLVLPLIDGTTMEVDLSRLMKFDEFIDSDTIAFSVKADGTVTAIVKEGSIQEKHLRPDYLADIRIEQEKAQSSAEKSEEFAKLSESYAHGGTGVREGEDTDNAMEYARQAKESADMANDVISNGLVTGIKGANERFYRTGNVSLGTDNILEKESYSITHFLLDSSWQDIDFEFNLDGILILHALVEVVEARTVESYYGSYIGFTHIGRGLTPYKGEYTEEILLDFFGETYRSAGQGGLTFPPVRFYLRKVWSSDKIVSLQVAFGGKFRTGYDYANITITSIQLHSFLGLIN